MAVNWDTFHIIMPGLNCIEYNLGMYVFSTVEEPAHYCLIQYILKLCRDFVTEF